METKKRPGPCTWGAGRGVSINLPRGTDVPDDTAHTTSRQSAEDYWRDLYDTADREAA